jgi:hypothetical protein
MAVTKWLENFFLHILHFLVPWGIKASEKIILILFYLPTRIAIYSPSETKLT